jgi:hypothetical protein
MSDEFATRCCPRCKKTKTMDHFINTKGNTVCYCQQCRRELGKAQAAEYHLQYHPKKPRKIRPSKNYYEKV